MKRKLIRQGKVGYTIYLPKKWVDRYGLKIGDEIDVVESGKALVLSTPKAIEGKKEARVSIDDPSKFMGRLVHTPYRFGYNEVEIRYSDISAVKKIQHYLDQLLGFEIVEQGANHMRIEMVAKEQETEFDKMLRRVLFMTLDMARELAAAAEKNDKENLKEIAAREAMSNRLTNFCERLLNKHGYTDARKAGFMYCTVWALEQVADDIRDICKALINTKKASNTIMHILKQLSIYVESFTILFYKHPYDEIWMFREKYYELNKRLDRANVKTRTEFRILALTTGIVEKLRHLTISLV